MDTLFLKIINNEIPSEKIYEDNKVIAILDISPVAPGHTLVIPKHPYKNIYEMSDESLNEVMTVVKKIAQNIKSKLNADGVNIIMNNEPAAGQIVLHAHIHVIPRYKNDGLASWHGAPYKEGEMGIIAEKLK